MSKENSFVLTTAVFPLVRLPYKKHDARNQLRGSLFEINVSTTSHVFCLLEKASSIHIFLSQLRGVICSFSCTKVMFLEKVVYRKRLRDELRGRRITFVNSNIESRGERGRGRKRVPVLSQLFCNSARMSSSALKERRIA